MKKKIILASRSKARQDILKKIGVKFQVMPSNAKEHHYDKISPMQVVKNNALFKARDVASRLKKGIVIGCDTLVWQKGRLFGKPRDLKEARMMLKKLSSHPHKLYTGIVVIDVEKQKEFSGVEETEIIMEKLSDAQISRYFKKVSPLDKAGGFDIQGLGGVFIRHIKGCYFNVVGLPLSKLNSLLKKVGVSLLVVLCSLNFFGCMATEYNVVTKKRDLMFYSTDKEVSIGDSVSQQVEKEYITVHDPEMNERLQRVGKKIVEVCDRKELFYRFRIIEDKKDKDIVNAVSLPGGYVYVFKNLMNVAETDDELAGVLGHEVGHIVARHSIKRLQAIWGYNLLSILAAQTGNADVAQGTQLAYVSLMMGYAQEDELLADQLGARYAKRAGYDPNGMIDFLNKLQERHKKEDPKQLSYFRTHPFNAARIRATKEEMGEKINFDDFINTM
ncbi:MAG: Maf family nucleotide pyrophosphatase [Candidatus Omnitrophota bacterium]